MKFEETFGLGKQALYHFWTIAIIIDVIATQLWFHSDKFSGGMGTPWITIGPLYTLSGGAVMLMYLTDLFVVEEDHYWKRQVYNALQAVLFFLIIGVAMDNGLMLMDKEYYCQLQKEPVMKDCEARNEWLQIGSLIFVICVPIFHQFNQVIRRYSEEEAKKISDAMDDIIKANMASRSPMNSLQSPRSNIFVKQ